MNVFKLKQEFGTLASKRNFLLGDPSKRMAVVLPSFDLNSPIDSKQIRLSL